MYGPRVTDLIAACALAIRLEATVDELITTVWAHPTVGEAIGEAALDVFQNPIHWPPKKKITWYPLSLAKASCRYIRGRFCFTKQVRGNPYESNDTEKACMAETTCMQ